MRASTPTLVRLKGALKGKRFSSRSAWLSLTLGESRAAIFNGAGSSITTGCTSRATLSGSDIPGSHNYATKSIFDDISTPLTVPPPSSSSPRGELSHVHRGTAFEERALRVLRTRLCMDLRRVGGKDDGGVDLLGWWWVPGEGGVDGEDGEEEGSLRRRIRVIGQCKAEKRKAGPRFVREMEGVVATRRDEEVGSGGVGYPVVAMLVSQSPFSKATLLRARSSPMPFFLLRVAAE